MTLEEAKDILKKEFAVINLHKSTEPFEFDDSNWFGYEKPSVLEAFRVLSKEGYYITISGHDYDMRKKRLEKEYEKNTKAPGSGEEQSKEGDLKVATKMFGAQAREIMRLTAENAELRETIDKMKEGNPALKEALAESASQFNDALLDEQAKKIAELTKENERLERVSKTTTDEFNELYYRMITKSDKIEALGKEIAKLNGIIHKKNLKIEELGKESSGHLEGKMKMFGENFDLEQKLKDKDAVLADVAEELRLSKIREKNLTEVCQKYMKEVEDLKEKLANKVVDKIDAQALKSAESALAYKEKVIDKLTKENNDYKKCVEEFRNKIADMTIGKIDIQNIRLKEKNKEIKELNDKLKSINKNRHNELAEKDEVIADLGKELAEAKKQNTAVMVDMTAKCLRAARESINDVFESYAAKYAKSSLDDLKEKAYELFNTKAHNLGLVGNKDGNGIIDQMVGADIAEEGEDHSGVIVLCGKDFIDAIKKMK